MAQYAIAIPLVAPQLLFQHNAAADVSTSLTMISLWRCVASQRLAKSRDTPVEAHQRQLPTKVLAIEEMQAGRECLYNANHVLS